MYEIDIVDDAQTKNEMKSLSFINDPNWTADSEKMWSTQKCCSNQVDSSIYDSPRHY